MMASGYSAGSCDAPRYATLRPAAMQGRSAGGEASMVMSGELLSLGKQVGARLRARGETVGVAESAAGGLIAAALLAVPGASNYFRGGAVVYTGYARSGFLRLPATLT